MLINHLNVTYILTLLEIALAISMLNYSRVMNFLCMCEIGNSEVVLSPLTHADGCMSLERCSAGEEYVID